MKGAEQARKPGLGVESQGALSSLSCLSLLISIRWRKGLSP